MNEEEKESIEEFRKQLRLAINIDDVTTVIRNDNAQTILNLIDKQQKENEELKNQEATARRINELLVQRYSNSIPIQKVKEKIRKNEEIIDISNDGDLIHELLQKNKVYEELLESEE